VVKRSNSQTDLDLFFNYGPNLLETHDYMNLGAGMTSNNLLNSGPGNNPYDYGGQTFLTTTGLAANHDDIHPFSGFLGGGGGLGHVSNPPYAGLAASSYGGGNQQMRFFGGALPPAGSLGMQ
jgi:hypothetical protein